MKKKMLQMNKKIFERKEWVILLVLIAFILTPIASNADPVPASTSDDYHGHLLVSARSDISIPLTDDNINTRHIVEKAEPTAVQKGQIGTYDVDADWFVSDDDLAALNTVYDTKSNVEITLHGQYMFDCPNPSCQDKPDYSLTGSTKIKVTFEAGSCKVTFDGNGGKVDGSSKKDVTLVLDNKNGVSLNSDSMPNKVNREGYIFKGWSTSKNKNNQFSKKTLIKEDTTLYAYWEKVAAAKPEEVKKETRTISKIDSIIAHNPTITRYNIVLNTSAIPLNNTTDGNNNSMNDSQDEGDYGLKGEFVTLAETQNVPIINIGNGSVPLFTPQGAEGWAFLNLVLAVMALLLGLVCIIISYMQGRNKKSLWFILSIIAGIAGPLLFVMTENIQLNMVIADIWTAINAILFIIAVVSIIMHFRKKEEVEEFIYNY